jgi:myo-inositol 2-dehydrogenase/D-chiro-inositol 1-dehydrogenase
MGALHAQVLAAHTGVGRLVLADANPAAARAVADALAAAGAAGGEGGCTIEVVDDPADLAGAGVEAIVIAVATPAHAPLIELAAREQLACFCEKPIALDLPTTDRALAAAERAGIYLQMGFNRRFDQGFAAARDAVADGTLGDLRGVRMGTHDPAPPPMG